MPHDRRRTNPGRTPDLRERDHHRPQHRLHHIHPVQPAVTGLATDHVQQRPVLGERRQRRRALGHPLREHRRGLQQLHRHRGPLRTLTREDERHLPRSTRHTTHDLGSHTTRRQRLKPPHRTVTVTRNHHRTLLEHRPRRHQRTTHVRQRHLRPPAQQRQQTSRLPRQRRLTLRRQHQRHSRRIRALRRRGRLDRQVLQDRVGVGAADAEGRHRRATRTTGLRPLTLLGQQLHRARSPIHLPRRLGDVQGLRQHTLAHRHDHLDDAADARRRLRVADVRLQRPQPQRPFGRLLLTVRREQGLGLDRVTEPGARAVRLDRVDLVGRQTRVGQGLPDHPLLRGTVGRRQTVARTVLVHRAAAHDREHRVAVALGVRQPLDEQHADALTPAGAVRVGGERLAAPVRGETALAAEVDEGLGRGHHGHTARECHRALAVAQRLDRPVQGDQRGGARGVDGDRRALQAQGVGDAPGGDAAGHTGAQVALDSVRQRADSGGVVVVHDAGEDAGPAALEGGRVDAGALDGLPGGLQQQALLRVHRQRLTRRDAEELRVEQARIVQEAALAGVGGALVVRVRVVEVVQVPATAGREAGDRVAGFEDEPPQVLGRLHAARVAAGHADDRDRLVDRHGDGRAGRSGVRGVAQQLGEEEGGQSQRAGVVEDQRRGQAQAGRAVELVAQLDGGQRVEAQLLEGPAGLDRCRVRVAQHRRHTTAHQVQQRTLALARRECQQTAGQLRAAGRTGPRDTTRRDPDQPAQQGGQRAGGSLGPQCGQVEAHRHQRRLAGRGAGVEEGQALSRGEPVDATSAHPLDVELVQAADHAAAVGPRAPGERGGGEALGPALPRQRVQEDVRGGVVALAGAAQRARGGGEEHERGKVRGEFVQVERGVQLRTQHRVQALGREGGDDPVVQHTSRVHHT